MGRDQGVDLRPTIVAFASVHSPVQHYVSEDTRVEEFIAKVGAVSSSDFRDLMVSTAIMFQDALDCSCLTAATLAYTLHCSANDLRI